jgi:hypothetical protein
MKKTIKEKIGLYKTLITLFWTAFVILTGGAYKLYHTQEFWLFNLSIAGIIILMAGFWGLVFRIKYWIRKMGEKDE